MWHKIQQWVKFYVERHNFLNKYSLYHIDAKKFFQCGAPVYRLYNIVYIVTNNRYYWE